MSDHMIGEQLGGRYEILSRIGGGGMALVYKAKDQLLSRFVAIKILRQQFVNDEDFIRRFRREAQSAASLSHPNIVSVYDVGQQEDIHYIVMEYVEGTNLNDKIKEQAPLQVEEAVNIAAQICDALDHAHMNQIIHRDIKPHNILISKNGRVKVTDFGIARAASASMSDITQTGSVIGSVHYFSPEHAKGISQGEVSDLYSLGIVLYQMLTGRLPFLGESPISVALKHLQEEVEEPRAVNPYIPQSVENIILRSMRKKPEERYPSAREMLEDLDTCLLPERLDEPKAVFDEDGEDEDRTLIMPAIRGGVRNAEGEPEDGDEEAVEEAPSRRWRWIGRAAWLVVILALIGAGGYGLNTLQKKLRGTEVQVPTVVNLPADQAQTKLKQLGLDAQPNYVYDDKAPKGTVLQQDPKPGTETKAAFVTLTISNGPKLITLDNYVGSMVDDAQPQLTALVGASHVKIDKVYSDDPDGLVIHQSPSEGAKIDPSKDVVTLTVSQGLGTVKVPNLIGLKQEVAQAILQKTGLKSRVQTGTSYTQKGLVFRQFPYDPNTQVEPDSEETILISTGYPADAREAVKNVQVDPTADGQQTSIRIEVSDARGDNANWLQRDITASETLPVTVILSNDTPQGVISIFQNEHLIDTITVTYQEAQPIAQGAAGQ